MKVQALHAAVAGRNADAVGAILDQGADPDARQHPALRSDDGKTAAAVAREHGHAALAARLENRPA